MHLENMYTFRSCHTGVTHKLLHGCSKEYEKYSIITTINKHNVSMTTQ